MGAIEIFYWFMGGAGDPGAGGESAVRGALRRFPGLQICNSEVQSNLPKGFAGGERGAWSPAPLPEPSAPTTALAERRQAAEEAGWEGNPAGLPLLHSART